MSTAPASHDRVDYLRLTGILDGSRTFPTFDRVCQVVSQLLEAPLALASFVAEDRQIFAGMSGTIPEPFRTARATPLSHSICQYVVKDGRALAIDDVLHEPWHFENRACTDLKVRAYLGVPLVNDAGLTIGSLCALDDQPRTWTAKHSQMLSSLAGMVMTELSLLTAQSTLASEMVQHAEVKLRREAWTRSVVHDLRTPLNNLLLGMQLLGEIGSLNQEQRAVLEMSMANGSNLSSLLSQIQEADLAAMATTQNLVADLAAESISQVAALALHRQQELDVEIHVGASVMLDCSRSDLVRSLVNLLANAIKYTPVGGAIKLGVRQYEDTVVFEVSDNGQGISAQDLVRVFDEGFRASNASSMADGRGLGLVLVKKVAQAHGGQIHARSDPGRGSVFTLTLPAGIRRQAGAHPPQQFP